MTADLTCSICGGSGERVYGPAKWCVLCNGTGRRPPRLAEWDVLVAERDRLREAIDDYLAHEDNHQPGEIVETGYGKEQLCTEDEACRRANYWPCPTERLRRARVALDSEGGET